MGWVWGLGVFFFGGVFTPHPRPLSPDSGEGGEEVSDALDDRAFVSMDVEAFDAEDSVAVLLQELVALKVALLAFRTEMGFAVDFDDDPKGRAAEIGCVGWDGMFTAELVARHPTIP